MLLLDHEIDLDDAGYNVLAYDIRNYGTSSAANNGIFGIGRWEWRDCVGVKKYVDSHPALGKMNVGLYSQCMGGNSQLIARRLDPFENVRCMFSPTEPHLHQRSPYHAPAYGERRPLRRDASVRQGLHGKTATIFRLLPTV